MNGRIATLVALAMLMACGLSEDERLAIKTARAIEAEALANYESTHWSIGGCSVLPAALEKAHRLVAEMESAVIAKAAYATFRTKAVSDAFRAAEERVDRLRLEIARAARDCPPAKAQ